MEMLFRTWRYLSTRVALVTTLLLDACISSAADLQHMHAYIYMQQQCNAMYWCLLYFLQTQSLSILHDQQTVSLPVCLGLHRHWLDHLPGYAQVLHLDPFHHNAPGVTGNTKHIQDCASNLLSKKFSLGTSLNQFSYLAERRDDKVYVPNIDPRVEEARFWMHCKRKMKWSHAWFQGSELLMITVATMSLSQE